MTSRSPIYPGVFISERGCRQSVFCVLGRRHTSEFELKRLSPPHQVVPYCFVAAAVPLWRSKSGLPSLRVLPPMESTGTASLSRTFSLCSFYLAPDRSHVRVTCLQTLPPLSVCILLVPPPNPRDISPLPRAPTTSVCPSLSEAF